MGLFKLEQKDAKVKDLPKQFQNGFKFSYNDIRKCTLKKELGESSEECKKMWKELNISEVGE